MCEIEKPGLVIRTLRDRVAALEALVREYLQNDLRVQRYAAVWLGVDEDGNGPGESKTGAAVVLKDRIQRAQKALGP